MVYPKRKFQMRANPSISMSNVRGPDKASLLDNCKLELDPTVKYRFPVMEDVPPDNYLTRLDFVEASMTAKGLRAVDTCQTFMNREGNLFHVRQRYVKDSVYYKQLIMALCAAGATPGRNISEAVGVIERVKFGYPTDSEIGSIIKRLPYEYKDGETQESLAEYFVDDSDG